MLTEYQKNAAKGDYVKVIGQYIGFILKHYDRIEAEINTVFDRYRNQTNCCFLENKQEFLLVQVL